MTAEDAIRYIAYDAEWCRTLEDYMTLCLQLPPLLRALNLRPMVQAEFLGFREQLKEAVNQQQKKCAAHLVRR
jgi:hypothetical protein